jgi:hypothetical protein
MIHRYWFLAVLFCLMGWFTAVGGPSAAMAEEGQFASPGAVVDEIYELVTFDTGELPDWEKVRALFIPEAVIVLRTTRTETTVFSVDGFVADFVSFIDRAKAVETGFAERIVRTKPMVFGDIAHILVLYEAQIPGSERGPQQGVDSFQLIRKDGRWWIASVVNEIPTPDRPVPAELRQ